MVRENAEADGWVRRVIMQAEPAIADTHGRLFLPRSWKVFGCGAFGCVMPTRRKDVVCKVTIDGSEAFFAKAQAELGTVPGVCRYWEPVRVPTDVVTAWVLWRQAVEMPDYRQYVLRAPKWPFDLSRWLDAEGAAEQEIVYARDRRDMAAWHVAHGVDADDILAEMTNAGLGVASRFDQFLRSSGAGVRGFFDLLGARMPDAMSLFKPTSALHGWRYTDDEIDADASGLSAAIGVLAYRFQLDRLRSSPTMPVLAHAVGHYLDNGLLLADLNSDNIAKVNGEWTLFDCGFTVPIAPRWNMLWSAEGAEPLPWWRGRWEIAEALFAVPAPEGYVL